MILLPYFSWQHIWPLFIQLLASSTNSWFPVISAWTFKLDTTWSIDQHKKLSYFRMLNILKMPSWRHFEIHIAPMFHTHTRYSKLHDSQHFHTSILALFIEHVTPLLHLPVEHLWNNTPLLSFLRLMRTRWLKFKMSIY